MSPTGHPAFAHTAWYLGARDWMRPVVWPAALGLLILLAAVRATTHAEFAFASLALLPVMLIAWITGRAGGLVIAVLATATWIFGDVVSDREHWRSWVPWVNGAIRLAVYGLVALLVAMLRELLERERDHARRDALTGLANRRQFFDAGGLQVERSRRYRHPVAVLFLDLDHFKQLNDRLGHDAGDAALRATGRALLAATRATDLVARLGGDEFAVILPEVDRAAAGQAGQRMWEAVTAALDPYPGVTSSAGVAWFGDPAPSLSTMLKAADSLMYQAKRERRGAVIVQDLSSERAGTASTGSLNAGPDPPAGPPGA